MNQSVKERGEIECEWFDNPTKAWVAKTWQALEARADVTVFLSWAWIGTWLDCFVHEFQVIEASYHGETVGLGIIVKKDNRLIGHWVGAKYYLHRTGIENDDQIWIEYNDFLVDQHLADAVRFAMSASVVYHFGPHDAFVVGASEPEKLANLTALGLQERKIWETTNYYLELAPLRVHHHSVLETLSRNARYQISRSLREYQHIGPVVVQKMSTAAAAVALFHQAKPFHLARWGEGRTGSGMVNPRFVAFHEQLITQGMDTGLVEMNHVRAGEETIGIVYNFNYRNRIYFYFGAMNYQHDNPHFKPGLVSHYLLIEQAVADGMDVYDFMGGTARYKSTFANQQGKLVVCRYEHPRWQLSAENIAREIKHRLPFSGNHHSI